MFSSVLIRKLFIAFFLIMLGLSSLLCLYFIFIMDADQTVRPPAGNAYRLIWGGIALLACGTFLAGAVIRYLLKPLWVVGDLAREFVRNGRIAENRYVAGAGEIGTLGAAFYQMTEKLAEKTDNHSGTIRSAGETAQRCRGPARENPGTLQGK